jgi:hypothetical protein
MLGLATSSTPSVVRLFCSIESTPAMASRISWSSSVSITNSTISMSWCLLTDMGRRRLAEYSRDSNTVAAAAWQPN